MSSPSARKAWAEGDMLFMKKMDESNREVYEAAGVTSNIANHPAVLLYRPSPSSEVMVVALMTSLGGKSLSEHRHSSSKPARRRAYVPIHPSPKNPKNRLHFHMTPKPLPKPSYIKTSATFLLPGKVLRRFGEYEGHDYALSREDTKKLLRFIKDDKCFLAAKKEASEHAEASSDSPLLTVDRITIEPQEFPYDRMVRSQERPSHEFSDPLVLPAQRPQVIPPPSTSIFNSVIQPQRRDPRPWPEIPGSYPTSPVQDRFTSTAPQHLSQVLPPHRTIQAVPRQEARYPAGPTMESGLSERTPLFDGGQHPPEADSNDKPPSGFIRLLFGVAALGLAYAVVHYTAVKGAAAAEAAAAVAWNGIVTASKAMLSVI